MIELLDSTLREGEQTPGVSFNADERLQIAQAIDRFGVDIIEIGNPNVSVDVAEAIRGVSNAGLKTPLLCHSLALKEHIEKVAEMNTEWIGLFFATSDISLKERFGISKKEALKRISESVEYASSFGLKVRFTPEDATRTDERFLVQVYNAALEAGAVRGSVADTVGSLTPQKSFELVSNLRKETKLPLHIHCHNDLGLATANSLAAYEAGITLIDVTVNGLGERAGITPLDELSVSLKKFYNVKNKWRIGMLPELSELVEKYSGVFNASNKPIVGRNVFSHKAGVHSDAVLKNPKTYEFLDPKEFKRERRIIVDKFAGKAAVKHMVKGLGYKANCGQLEEIVLAIKNRNRKYCSELDVIRIIENVLNISKEREANVNALLLVSTTGNSYLNDLREKFSELPEIITCSELAGEYDLCLRVKTDSMRKMNLLADRVRESKHVENTNTMVILNE